MYLNILIDLIYSICYKPLLRIGLFFYLREKLNIIRDIYYVIILKDIEQN